MSVARVVLVQRRWSGEGSLRGDDRRRNVADELEWDGTERVTPEASWGGMLRRRSAATRDESDEQGQPITEKRESKT